MKLFSYPSFRLFNWQRINQEEPTEEADAIILALTNMGQLHSGLHEIIILLQVMPLRTRKYITELKQTFSDHDLHNLKAGSRIRIYFHTKNPSRVYWMEKKTNGL